MKECIQNAVFSISPAELRRAIKCLLHATLVHEHTKTRFQHPL